MTDETCVSVVIPYSPQHTPAKMLEEAKRSVKNQSVSTEIIVVEDTEQRGPAWARNRGIDRSETRFVAFLDADDRWYKNKLKRQLCLINENHAGICVEGDSKDKSGPIDVNEFIERILFGELSSLTSSILIDRNSINTRFREDLDRLEDHLFMIEAAIESDICIVSAPVVEINKHDHGLSARGTPEKMYHARLTATEYLCEHPETEQYTDRLRWLAHYGLGRQRQLQQNYLASVSPLVQSLSYKVSIKSIGALLLIPWQLLKDAT